jgi:tripartite-type tricarboxylate transporter receptor subunit TctC
MAPAGTPREILDKLARALNEALKSEEVLKTFRTQGFDPLGGTPEELAAFITTEVKKWSDAAQAAGLKK